MKRLAALFALVAVSLFAQTSNASAQAPEIRWRFGMNVSVVQKGTQRGLAIKWVQPGSPAAQAGLKPGQVIVSSNETLFGNAENDSQGVALLQASVRVGGGVGGGGVPTSFPTVGTAVLIVVRPCGTTVQRSCYPQYVGAVPTL